MSNGIILLYFTCINGSGEVEKSLQQEPRQTIGVFQSWAKCCIQVPNMYFLDMQCCCTDEFSFIPPAAATLWESPKNENDVSGNKMTTFSYSFLLRLEKSDSIVQRASDKARTWIVCVASYRHSCDVSSNGPFGNLLQYYTCWQATHFNMLIPPGVGVLPGMPAAGLGGFGQHSQIFESKSRLLHGQTWLCLLRWRRVN